MHFSLHPWHQMKWYNKQSPVYINKMMLLHMFFYTRCFCAPNLRAWVARSFKHSPLSVRAGGRILILVRQADPRFTPRVWLVPIVHCQGLLMERQQWIPSPHKWLSDRAPSSITSYNVEVQKMRPLGGLIWCFICSFEILFNPPPPSLQQLYVPVHALGCKQSKSVQNYAGARRSVRGRF